MKQLLLALLFVQIFLFNNGYCQEIFDKPYLKLFIDCDDCDLTNVRQNLLFISFVREPGIADVHLLVTDSPTGGGGRKYFLNFIGINDFKNHDCQYEWIADASCTEDDIRKSLLKFIKVGILHYVSQTNRFAGMDVDIKIRDDSSSALYDTDPWKNWVFRIDLGGDFKKEESQNEYSIETEVLVEKITDAWKFRLEGNFQIDQENYFDDGDKIAVRQNETEWKSHLVESLSNHWSAGVFAEYNSSTYMNIDHSLRLDAAIEYNFFPWDESNRRILAIGYRVGAQSFDYMEETIYDQLNELRVFETIKATLELMQPWGTVDVGLEGKHFFYDFSKNRLTLESEISIRLSRKLSVVSKLDLEVVHDQLYLSKGDALLEDILLKRHKLGTTYEIGGMLGFRYTFGSIFNNVVNERM